MKQKNSMAKDSVEINSNKLDNVAHCSLLALAWRRFCHHRLALVSLFIAGLYTFLTLLSPVLPIHSYREQITFHSNLPPSLEPVSKLLLERLDKQQQALLRREKLSKLTPEMIKTKKKLEERIATEKMVDFRGREIFTHQRRYLLGTDALGRDLLARTLYGGRVSILIGIIGAVISMVLGSLIGALCGYIGGLFDYFTMRVVDIIYCIPFLIIVVILTTILGRGFINIFIAISLASWLTAARVVRGQIFSLRNLTFVEAAVAMGASKPRILFVHLLPNCLSLIIVYSTLRVPGFILFESFLSYLGLGISAPLATWGLLIREGTVAMTVYSWQLWVPAIAMSIFLMIVNLLGDGLRDAFDPKHKAA